MKHGLLAMILSASVGLAGMVASHDVQAAPTKGAKKDDKKDEKKAEPGKLEAAPKLTPPGLEFKMSPKKVYEVYDKAIEKDYVKKYKEVEPGIQMQRLDYEKSQFKQAFRLSYLDL
ncbi:MAG: hypothetical protein KC731_42235, partial [Myxococcales bacterium]|nr:hypothetical protein [Myxococcales bacterium]